jgi:hypothetical protein
MRIIYCNGDVTSVLAVRVICFTHVSAPRPIVDKHIIYVDRNLPKWRTIRHFMGEPGVVVLGYIVVRKKSAFAWGGHLVTARMLVRQGGSCVGMDAPAT